MSVDSSPWNREGYADVVAVEPAADAVRVRFADGDEVEVEVASLGLGPMAQFEVDEEAGALVARDAGAEREIDWMVLRSLSDPAFAEEVRRRDAEEARRIGRRLRALRENRGIAQKVVAQVAGMSAPQLSKLEQGETDMRLSTIRSVLRALDASLTDITGPDAPEVSVKELSARAKKANAPAEVLKRIAVQAGPAEFARALARAFAWDLDTLLTGGSPQTPALNVQVAFSTRSAEEVRRSPMVALARTISELVAERHGVSPGEVPDNAAVIRKEVIDRAGEVSLSALLEWAWDRGVVVIPMLGPGFSGAAWYVGDHPVAVVKVPHNTIAQWLFVLAHEIGHLALGHVKPGSDAGVVDEREPADPRTAEGAEREREANEFAFELLIPNRRSLFEEIRRRSGTSLDEQKRKFKWRAKDVAEEAGLNVPVLALAAAHDLTDVAEPRDRWGSATNLAKEEGEARPIAVSAFRERVSLDGMDELDAALVQSVVLE